MKNQTAASLPNMPGNCSNDSFAKSVTCPSLERRNEPITITQLGDGMGRKTKSYNDVHPTKLKTIAVPENMISGF